MLTPMVPSALTFSAGAIVMHQEVTALAACHDVTLATLATGNDEQLIRDLREMLGCACTPSCGTGSTAPGRS